MLPIKLNIDLITGNSLVTPVRKGATNRLLDTNDLVWMCRRQPISEPLSKCLDLQHLSNVMKIPLQLPSMPNLLNEPFPRRGKPLNQSSSPASSENQHQMEPEIHPYKCQWWVHQVSYSWLEHIKHFHICVKICLGLYVTDMFSVSSHNQNVITMNSWAW